MGGSSGDRSCCIKSIREDWAVMAPPSFPSVSGPCLLPRFTGLSKRPMPSPFWAEAMDRGVNHIDTANIYGMGLAEDIIGEFIRKTVLPPVISLLSPARWGSIAAMKNARSAMIQAISGKNWRSPLKRLGVDCLDLYYIHRREADIPIEDVAGTLKDLIAEGKIKSFGFSEIAPSSLRRAAAVHPVAAVQSGIFAVDPSGGTGHDRGNR